MSTTEQLLAPYPPETRERFVEQARKLHAHYMPDSDWDSLDDAARRPWLSAGSQVCGYTALGEWAPWERAYEYVSQEGCDLWRELRVERSYDRDVVEYLTNIPAAQQELWEDYGYTPELHELAALATLYNTSPAELLRRALTPRGEEE